MGVLPLHQNKKVGTALLKWGLQEADKNGKEVCLTATPEGKELYLKHGFKIKRTVTMNLEDYGGNGEYTQTFMVRDKVL